jgi:hypothetical protein
MSKNAQQTNDGQNNEIAGKWNNRAVSDKGGVGHIQGGEVGNRPASDGTKNKRS